MITYDDKDYVDTALSYLPPSERYLVNAIYFDMRTYDDVGNDFKVTHTTVGTMLRQIKRMLRKICKQLDAVKEISVNPVISSKSCFYLTPEGKPDLKRIKRKKRKLAYTKQDNTDHLLTQGKAGYRAGNGWRKNGKGIWRECV